MSTTARKTLRNTSLLVALEVANPLFALLLVGVLSRKLGADGLGAYNLLLNFFFTAHAITTLGLNTLIIREVSRDPRKAITHLCSSSVLGLSLSLGVAIALVAMLRLVDYGPEVSRCGWMVGLSLLPSVVILYSESIFIAFEKIQIIVVRSVLENALKVLSGLWLIHAGYGIEALILSFMVLRYLALLLNLAAFHTRIAPLSWQFDNGVTRELLKSVPVFGSILVVATLYLRADVFILSQMSTLASVGYYTAGCRLFVIAGAIPRSFNTSIFPLLSNLFTRSVNSYREVKSLSIRYILVVVFPIAAGISGLAEPIVRLLFGQDFGRAASVLKVVIWTLVPYGVSKVLASSMFASNRQVMDLKVNALGLLANVLLNIALIPRFGEVACAWSWLLSMLFFVGCQVFYLREEIWPILRRAEMLRPALAASGILIWTSLTNTLFLPMRVLGGALIYTLLVFLLQAVSPRELRAILPEGLVGLLPGSWKS